MERTVSFRILLLDYANKKLHYGIRQWKEGITMKVLSCLEGVTMVFRNLERGCY